MKKQPEKKPKKKAEKSVVDKPKELTVLERIASTKEQVFLCIEGTGFNVATRFVTKDKILADLWLQETRPKSALRSVKEMPISQVKIKK